MGEEQWEQAGTLLSESGQVWREGPGDQWLKTPPKRQA